MYATSVERNGKNKMPRNNFIQRLQQENEEYELKRQNALNEIQINTNMRSYRIEIKPNKTQLQLIKQSCDVARFAYNWMLGKKIAERESLISLAKMWDLETVPNIHGSSIDWLS